MPSTTVYSFGDVVLVPFPFTDQTGIKKRPAIVVSSAAYNAQRRDLIVMPVTKIRPTGAFGECLVHDWKKAGLLVPSLMKPILATLEKRLVLRRLGRLQAADRKALVASLHSIMS